MLQEVALGNYTVTTLPAFFIYVAVNMGMVLGLLPIVGAHYQLCPMEDLQ